MHWAHLLAFNIMFGVVFAQSATLEERVVALEQAGFVNKADLASSMQGVCTHNFVWNIKQNKICFYKFQYTCRCD